MVIAKLLEALRNIQINCETFEAIKKLFQRVSLRAERSESVPALYLFLLNHSQNPKKNHTVSQISQLPKHYISANGGNLV